MESSERLARSKQIEDALDLGKVLELIKTASEVDLDQLQIDKQSPTERIFTERERTTIERRLRTKVKPRKTRKQHWKIARRKQREYYKASVYPTLLRKSCELVEREGWYPVMLKYWKRMGFKVTLTREEWDTHIGPKVGEGLVPSAKRYYTDDNEIRLDNILVYTTRQGRDITRKSLPVFDGKEFHLKALGYIL